MRITQCTMNRHNSGDGIYILVSQQIKLQTNIKPWHDARHYTMYSCASIEQYPIVVHVKNPLSLSNFCWKAINNIFSAACTSTDYSAMLRNLFIWSILDTPILNQACSLHPRLSRTFDVLQRIIVDNRYFASLYV